MSAPDQTKVEAVIALREQGLSLKKIASAVGLSVGTVRRYIDPVLAEAELERNRERKKRYKGKCIDCGAPTSYSGKGKTGSRRCASCANVARKYWTREKVIEAIHLWNEEFGRPPSSVDWNAARSRGKRDRKKYPSIGAVYGPSGAFNSWAEAIEAAGFPRPKPTYGAGHRQKFWTEDKIIEALQAHAVNGVAPKLTDWSHSTPGVHPTSAWVIRIFGSWSKACHRAGLQTFQESYYHGPLRTLKKRGKIASDLEAKRLEFVQRAMDDSVLRKYIVGVLWRPWGFTKESQMTRWLARKGILEFPGHQFRPNRQLTKEEIAEGLELASSPQRYRLDDSEV